MNFNQWLIDFINGRLISLSTVNKIHQLLIEIYQPSIFFINGMLFDTFVDSGCRLPSNPVKTCSKSAVVMISEQCF